MREAYYPYIDGLRAFAVLSVLIYHLHAPWLPGGFVGVDVFFVISGFVVTASLARFDRKGLGTLLAHFYARRIRRIFPALIVCLIATTLVSTLFIPASWLSGVNERTGLYAFFGLSNFVLAQTGRDYFAPATDFNPFTHTWSLAVEEQFYLLFPLLLMPWLRSPRGRYLSVSLFAIGLALSAGIAGWQSIESPTQAFYLAPARFWELAVGVLLYQSLALAPALHQAGSTGLRTGIATVSLSVLGASFFMSSAERFPMPGALWAVIGTAGFILSVHGREDVKLFHRAVGSAVLVRLGRISYSLYLWHWPVFVLFRWTFGLDTFALQLIAVCLAFGLASLSYIFVERPMRHFGNDMQGSGRATVGVGLAGILAAWALASQLMEHQLAVSMTAPGRAPVDWYPDAKYVDQDHVGCDASPEYQWVEGGLRLVYEPRGCVQPRPTAETTLYVIGDSHALAYQAMFSALSISRSMKVIAYNNGGCPYASLQAWRDLDNPLCRAHGRAALADIQKNAKAGDVLFLASMRMPRMSDQWGPFPEQEIQHQVLSSEARTGRARAIHAAAIELKPLASEGVQIILEGPKPVFKAPPFRCSNWFNRTNPVCGEGLDIPRAELEQYRQPILDALHDLTMQLPGSGVWDPFPILCPDEAYCHAMIDASKPLFFDGDHLSGAANRILLPFFERFVFGKSPE